MVWIKVRLDEIGRIVTGKTPSTKQDDYFNGSIHFVTPADLNACNKSIIETARTLTIEGLNSIKSNTIPAGAICVSCIGNIGYVGMATMDCASNQQINSIVVNDKCDKDFIYYSMRNLWPYFKSLEGQSTTVSILNKGQFSKIEIPLPDLPTQRRISSILSSLDRKIELNNKINATLEEMAQALFKSWFVDFEPFKNGNFIDTEIGKIPEGWRVEAFEDFLKATTEKTGVEGIPEYSVTNSGIHPRDGKFNKSLSKSSAKNKLLRKGNLVFGMSREILNWGIMKEEIGGVSSAYNIYIVDESKVPTLYLELFIKHRMDYFHDLIKPASREGQGLDKAALMSKFIYLPSEEAYKRFLEVYEPLVKQVSALTQETLTLTHLRDTLLPRLMSGEIEL